MWIILILFERRGENSGVHWGHNFESLPNKNSSCNWFHSNFLVSSNHFRILRSSFRWLWDWLLLHYLHGIIFVLTLGEPGTHCWISIVPSALLWYSDVFLSSGLLQKRVDVAGMSIFKSQNSTSNISLALIKTSYTANERGYLDGGP